ncbi:MAG: IspD/TarI family cytidylyltransferase [Acidimicrobiia bacterium]
MADHTPRVGAIVVAAGRGVRFGGPKHDVAIGDEPMWRRSVQTFTRAGVFNVVVVGDVPGGVPGGERRRDSVRAGLDALRDAEWVFVHDAARPLMTEALVVSLLALMDSEEADGVVPVVPVADTLKRVKNDVVVSTVERSDLFSVQTPQLFSMETLMAAHAMDENTDVTDDAGLVEMFGGTVRTVVGDPQNIKITQRGDLEVALAILDGRESL